MICHSCNTHYVNGMSLCPDCGIPLLDDEESEALDQAIGELQAEWVHIYTTNTEIDAEMMKGNLQSAGIPTHVLLQIDTTRQFTIGGLAIAKVFVRSTDVHDAVAIIRDIERRSTSEE